MGYFAKAWSSLKVNVNFLKRQQTCKQAKHSEPISTQKKKNRNPSIKLGV